MEHNLYQALSDASFDYQIMSAGNVQLGGFCIAMMRKMERCIALATAQLGEAQVQMEPDAEVAHA